ncbi:response regulator [Deferribacter abyssi]|uniref:response regulator n=1 Tax=Deferribacter abyssi TaxID=213806 RepID=UPI003C1BD226
MYVWLIDDNTLHTMFFKFVCEELGVKYKVFLSAAKARNELKNVECEEDIPDAVFIDLVLENGERGESLLDDIKSMCSNKRLKFIAFTADIVQESSLKSIGFDKIVYKPINKSKLIDILKGLKYEFSRISK